MSGIEKAFKDFVKRVSEKEDHEQKSSERGYQYGGGAIGYSEGGYPPVEDPMIANEFRNSGIMNYPISFGNLGIRPRVDIQSGMTSSPDPYTRIKTSNQNYGGDIGYKLTDNLNATGSIDYNRSKTRQDYNVPYFDQYGNKVFEDKGSMNNVYKSPMDVRLGLNYQTPQTNANISVNPRTRDLMARYNYSFADGGGVETLFRPKYADGGTYSNISTLPIDSISNPSDPYGYTGKNYGYLTLTDIQNIFKNNQDTGKVNLFGTDIPLGDLKSTLDLYSAGNMDDPNLKYYIRNLPEGALALNSTSTSTSTTTEIPTVDPFSGKQISAQDQAAFTQPQPEIFSQQPSSTEQFIAQKQFQSEADAAARNGTPFTKTLQDYLSPVAGAAYGKSVLDAFNQIGLTPAKQMLVNEALNSPSGIARALLGEVGGGFRPTPGGVGLGEYIGQGLKSLGQAATLNTANLGVNPAVGGGTLGSRVLGNLIGGPAIFATALLNPTTMGNSELTPQMRSQQEAAARVPMKMKSGGYVNTHLTTTVPPVKGPMSQGVETLFKRRYN
jgi:hypothetical protein